MRAIRFTGMRCPDRRAVVPSTLLAALVISMAVPEPATAGLSLTFGKVSGDDPDTAGQYTVDVYGAADGAISIGSTTFTAGINQALFVVTNAGPIKTAIADIWFQSNDPLDGINQLIQDSTNFSLGTNPDNPPGGNFNNPNMQNVTFRTSTPNVEYSGQVDDMPPANGVTPNDSTLGIVFDLSSGTTFDMVIDALKRGIDDPGSVWLTGAGPDGGKDDPSNSNLGIRIMLRARSVGTESAFGARSTEFIATDYEDIAPVPEPSTLAMAVAASLSLVLIGRRHRRLGGLAEA